MVRKSFDEHFLVVANGAAREPSHQSRLTVRTVPVSLPQRLARERIPRIPCADRSEQSNSSVRADPVPELLVQQGHELPEAHTFETLLRFFCQPEASFAILEDLGIGSRICMA